MGNPHTQGQVGIGYGVATLRIDLAKVDRKDLRPITPAFPQKDLPEEQGERIELIDYLGLLWVGTKLAQEAASSTYGEKGL